MLCWVSYEPRLNPSELRKRLREKTDSEASESGSETFCRSLREPKVIRHAFTMWEIMLYFLLFIISALSFHVFPFHVFHVFFRSSRLLRFIDTLSDIGSIHRFFFLSPNMVISKSAISTDHNKWHPSGLRSLWHTQNPHSRPLVSWWSV